MKKLVIACCIPALVFLAACQPKTRFTWGGYDTALYSYYKDPTEIADYREALQEAIKEGSSNGTLAPGLYAELGYTYLQAGNKNAAIGLFERERAAFPESSGFMTSVIERLQVSPPAVTAPSLAGTEAGV